ncbi:spore coat protein [Paenibacillus sp. CN-4]|uniref:spore coat protein n=1 Tax=Paenibacillus nanchangensis TaxID=3348343 RepID=UPI0039782F15
MYENQAGFMQDKDLLNIILADLKRTVREYTTAATESSCPTVRRMFNDLTMDTLRLQGDLYNRMQEMNMYSAPAKALRPELDKQISSTQQAQSKLRQFIQQKTGGGVVYAQSPNVAPHQPNVDSYYM